MQKDNQDRYEHLLLQRSALEEHAQKLLAANEELETEFEQFVKIDESVVNVLNRRDENVSPIRQQYSQHYSHGKSGAGATGSKVTSPGTVVASPISQMP